MFYLSRSLLPIVFLCPSSLRCSARFPYPVAFAAVYHCRAVFCHKFTSFPCRIRHWQHLQFQSRLGLNISKLFIGAFCLENAILDGAASSSSWCASFGSWHHRFRSRCCRDCRRGVAISLQVLGSTDPI
jgi:hypothetical protein